MLTTITSISVKVGILASLFAELRVSEDWVISFALWMVCGGALACVAYMRKTHLRLCFGLLLCVTKQHNNKPAKN